MAPATIFVVDDDEAVRDSLKLLLEAYGMEVEDYGSVADFARHYRPRQRACLILDLHLPGMTGLDFLASPEGAGLRLPIIMMTGRSDDSLKRRAAEAGVAAYLEKPVTDDALLGAISRAVARDPLVD